MSVDLHPTLRKSSPPSVSASVSASGSVSPSFLPCPPCPLCPNIVYEYDKYLPVNITPPVWPADSPEWTKIEPSSSGASSGTFSGAYCGMGQGSGLLLLHPFLQHVYDLVYLHGLFYVIAASIPMLYDRKFIDYLEKCQRFPCGMEWLNNQPYIKCSDHKTYREHKRGDGNIHNIRHTYSAHAYPRDLDMQLSCQEIWKKRLVCAELRACIHVYRKNTKLPGNYPARKTTNIKNNKSSLFATKVMTNPATHITNDASAVDMLQATIPVRWLYALNIGYHWRRKQNQATLREDRPNMFRMLSQHLLYQDAWSIPSIHTYLTQCVTRKVPPSDHHAYNLARCSNELYAKHTLQRIYSLQEKSNVLQSFLYIAIWCDNVPLVEYLATQCDLFLARINSLPQQPHKIPWRQQMQQLQMQLKFQMPRQSQRQRQSQKQRQRQRQSQPISSSQDEKLHQSYLFGHECMHSDCPWTNVDILRIIAKHNLHHFICRLHAKLYVRGSLECLQFAVAHMGWGDEVACYQPTRVAPVNLELYRFFEANGAGISPDNISIGHFSLECLQEIMSQSIPMSQSKLLFEAVNCNRLDIVEYLHNIGWTWTWSTICTILCKNNECAAFLCRHAQPQTSDAFLAHIHKVDQLHHNLLYCFDDEDMATFSTGGAVGASIDVLVYNLIAICKHFKANPVPIIQSLFYKSEIMSIHALWALCQLITTDTDIHSLTRYNACGNLWNYFANQVEESTICDDFFKLNANDLVGSINDEAENAENAKDAKDAESEDAESEDTESEDAESEDTESEDAESEDTESEDTESEDAESEDTKAEDAESDYTESEDAESEDTESDYTESEDAEAIQPTTKLVPSFFLRYSSPVYSEGHTPFSTRTHGVWREMHRRGWVSDGFMQFQAVRHCNLECAQYMHEHNIPWSYSVRFSDIRSMKYAVEHGYKWHADDLLGVVEDYRLNEVANKQMIYYAINHGCPYQSVLDRHSRGLYTSKSSLRAVQIFLDIFERNKRSQPSTPDMIETEPS